MIIRTFRPGADEDDWIAVNARAFADHPEQGRITRRDLDDRLAESWFDPAGFFVAISAGRMVGFHWTKQHEDQLGEVYVLGVDPVAGGQGLGKALLTTGLRHLKRRGKHPRPALRRGGPRRQQLPCIRLMVSVLPAVM